MVPLPTRIPTKLPLIVPALLMPPVKVGPVTCTAVPAEMTVLLLPIKRPRLLATIVPLSMVEPLIVLLNSARPLPVGALIEPLLTMSPVPVTEAMTMAVPEPGATIVPELVTPPCSVWIVSSWMP